MNTRLTLDKAGRVVLPKSLRDELGLGAGDTLELESAAGKITLRPVRAATPLTKEKGVWVFRTGQRMGTTEADDLLRRIRDEREERNFPVNG